MYIYIYIHAYQALCTVHKDFYNKSANTYYYTYVYICVCIHAYVHVSMYICVYVCMCISLSLSLSLSLYIYIYILSSTHEQADSEEFIKMEGLGLKEIAYAGFVLVAGGLGERLGYIFIYVCVRVCVYVHDCVCRLCAGCWWTWRAPWVYIYICMCACMCVCVSTCICRVFCVTVSIYIFIVSSYYYI